MKSLVKQAQMICLLDTITLSIQCSANNYIYMYHIHKKMEMELYINALTNFNFHHHGILQNKYTVKPVYNDHLMG